MLATLFELFSALPMWWSLFVINIVFTVMGVCLLVLIDLLHGYNAFKQIDILALCVLLLLGVVPVLIYHIALRSFQDTVYYRICIRRGYFIRTKARREAELINILRNK